MYFLVFCYKNNNGFELLRKPISKVWPQLATQLMLQKRESFSQQIIQDCITVFTGYTFFST